jgi:hypothetical protein
MNKQDIQKVINAIETDLIGPRRKAIAILQAALAEPSEPAGTFQLYEGVYEHMADSYTGDDAVKLFTHPAIKLDDDRIADLENSFEIERLKAEKAFYKNRVELLHKWQSKMRDPERTLVCDILANGQIWHDESRYTPQTSKPEPSEPFSKVLQSATNYDGTWSALVTAPCWLPTGLPLFTHPASSNHLDEISKVLHYPDCWDTAAYPTLEDAIIEAKSWAHCTNEDCQCPTKEAR